MGFNRLRRLGALSAALAAALCLGGLAACGSSGSGGGAGAAPSASGAGASEAGASGAGANTAGATRSASEQFYVSIGDSYAAGFQPTGKREGHTTTNGFAYQLVGAAQAKGYHLRLVNFGCGGATTTSLLRQPVCDHGRLGPGAAPYGTTQVAAATEFLRQHRGEVALVTVSIGGNDVTSCATAPNPVSCVASAVNTIKTNLGSLLTQLRGAAGPEARIVGITYPDVILGGYLSRDAATRQQATLSVTAFKSLINPTLKKAYESAGGSFVDVTAATGAYGPLARTTQLAGYGRVPEPVAKVCELTFYCQYQDIHPRTNGYALISSLIVQSLPPHRAG